MHKILILSGDKAAGGFLGMLFQREHFLPILASSAEVALRQNSVLQPDLLLVDLPLAGIGPLELCIQIRACQIDKPMILVADSHEEIDKILALEAGADCYITKPFAPRELVARVRALLRCNGANLDPVIRFGNIEVDRQRRLVTCQGEELRMTPCEYKLLLFFLENPNMALTRHTLLSSVWDYQTGANTRTLDVFVSKLRDKCEPNPGAPRHFLTIHGVGYRFVM